jgi:hypothetical protein
MVSGCNSVVAGVHRAYSVLLVGCKGSKFTWHSLGYHSTLVTVSTFASNACSSEIYQCYQQKHKQSSHACKVAMVIEKIAHVTLHILEHLDVVNHIQLH